jgi:uncharacterized membrane protein
MATLSVLKFNDPEGAAWMLIALQRMQERRVITLEDAAVVSWPEGYDKPRIPRDHDTAGWGALGGAFWGFLFGLIFFVPLLGAAIGAGVGAALSKSLEEGGIDEEFIEQVSEKVTEGTSALFVLTSGAHLDEVAAQLKRSDDFEIISTNLPEEQKHQLREAFAQAG